MTFSSKTLRDGVFRLMRYSSFVLLPALAAEAATQANYSQRKRSSQSASDAGGSRNMGSIPYLAVIAPPSLRFREAPAPPVFELEPVPSGPAMVDEPGYVQPAHTVAKVQHQEPTVVVPGAVAKEETVATPAKKQEVPAIPAILPDDLRRDIRPEDILPFFQFPKSGATMGVGVPVPAQAPAPAIPPSSATYRLQ